MTNNLVFKPDMAAKKIYLSREFNASVKKVWRAWTEPELIDKWIAPAPWRAETKISDFRVGGAHLYAMIGTEGQRFWVYAEYTAIELEKLIGQTGMGSDGEGNPLHDMPKTYRITNFNTIEGNRTKVDSVITFEDEATLKWFAEGGFKEGTAMGFSQLDELLAGE